MSVSRVTPALLTRISSRPNRSTTASTVFCTLSPLFTSHDQASASPPAALIASTVDASFSAFRATQATFAPAAPSRSAIARPMPCEAPVTSATCPERFTLRSDEAALDIAVAPVAKMCEFGVARMVNGVGAES